MPKYVVTRSAQAHEDIVRLSRENRPAYEAMKKIIEMLSNQDDPRNTQHMCIETIELCYDAPGWYRAKTTHNWIDPNAKGVRIIFRMMQKVNGEVVEVGKLGFEARLEDRAIQIMHVFVRGGKDYYSTNYRYTRSKS